jgi:hypothetical protein
MHGTQLHIWLQIVVADGRNLSVRERQVLHLFRHLYADLMEKLSPLYQLVVLSSD